MAAKRSVLVKILVVDDDPDICEYMDTFLTGEGYSVATLTDPHLVVDEVKRGGYHLVILDLMMPKLDGLEVLRRIRAVDTDLAIVIFTGYPSLDTAVASLKLEAIDYVRKPFSVDEFRQVLDRVMAKKGLSRTREEEVLRHIGIAIRELRMERGLTLRDLARRSGLSTSQISQAERGTTVPTVATLFRLASALDVKIADLLGDY